MQELQTPELQPLAMESKAALALLKYLPLSPHVIPQVSFAPGTLPIGPSVFVHMGQCILAFHESARQAWLSQCKPAH